MTNLLHNPLLFGLAALLVYGGLALVVVIASLVLAYRTPSIDPKDREVNP